jgi:hypothetical protein
MYICVEEYYHFGYRVMKANQHVTSIFEGKEQGKQESIIEYA